MSIHQIIKLLPLAGTGLDNFFAVYRLYFDMLKGDVWACIMMQEIMRLQNSEGGKENGGWAVFTFEHIQETYYISRHIFNNAIEALKPHGLKAELKRHPKYTHALRGVWHYRIEEKELLDSVLNYLSGQDSADLKKFHDVTSKILTSSPENFSDIIKMLEEVVEKIYAHPPKGDVRSASDTSLGATTPLPSSSKKNAKGESQEQPPTPPNSAPPPPSPKKRAPRVQVTTTPPPTHDSSHAPKPPRAPNDYQRIAGKVASVIFGIPEGSTEKGMMKRVGLIAGYLWGSAKSMQAPRPANEDDTQKADNIIADVVAFKAWWGRVYRDAHTPKDMAKFAENWIKFWHDSRKSFYTPATATQYEVVVWNDYSDDLGGEVESE